VSVKQQSHTRRKGGGYMKHIPVVTMATLTVAILNLAAQGTAEVRVRTYAGLTVLGVVGGVYSIECLPDLTEPASGRWRCLEYLQLPASPYVWIDKSTAATGQRFYRAVAMEAPTNMVFIPPGTFQMGSPDDQEDRWSEEGPVTEVIISRGFWMGRFEVTQGDYQELMGSNPSHFTGVQCVFDPVLGRTIKVDYTDPRRPVENVSWDDATRYCDSLTQRERAAGRISPNAVYRLPTEAEWEYACRARTSTRFSYGDDPGYTDLTHYAWYGDNSEGQTHPVGQKLPNAWGLHDMHGNVYEWCKDYFGDYHGGIAVDPQGPRMGQFLVFRGGGWSCWIGHSFASLCRSTNRGGSYPGYSYSRVGFRVVLVPGRL